MKIIKKVKVLPKPNAVFKLFKTKNYMITEEIEKYKQFRFTSHMQYMKPKLVSQMNTRDV